MLNKRFIRRSPEEEMFLLNDPKGEFDNLKKYLLPLIQQGIKRTRLTGEEARRVQQEILRDVPDAVSNFISHSRDEEGLSFSVYFTWYIAQRVNRES